MAPRVALVTGASGFVGGHLVRGLLAAGWEVHAILRPDSVLAVGPGHEEQIMLHRHTGSMESMLDIVATARPDTVIHLASCFLSEHQSVDVAPLVATNIAFGAQLLEAVAVNEVPAFINTGTAWQHFQGQAYSPVNLYAATKQAFEALLQYYVEAKGLRALTLKLADTYGPGDPRPKLVNLLLRLAASGEALSMSPGGQSVDLVHIDDVVSAFQQAADYLAGQAAGTHQAFSVSSGQPLLLTEVVACLEEVLGRKLAIEWGGRPYREREVMQPWVGECLPGWAPHTALAEGFRGLLS